MRRERKREREKERKRERSEEKEREGKRKEREMISKNLLCIFQEVSGICVAVVALQGVDDELCYFCEEVGRDAYHEEVEQDDRNQPYADVLEDSREE